MCDTVVALPVATAEGSMLFGKNSDREPWEPLFLERIRNKDHPRGAKLRCTHIEIDQSPHTYDILICRPSWTWGAEMGVNEHGVVVGNEAVFTRKNFTIPSLIGMDLVRLALERSSNAEEGVEIVTRLLEKYGQGGRCAFKGKLQYHNSFLIADYHKAFVLETAGLHWVAYKIQESGAISNTLTVRRHFERYSQSLTNRISRQIHPDRSFDFKRTFERKIHTRLGGGEKRLHITQSFMRKWNGSLTYTDIAALLRYHHSRAHTPRFSMKRKKDICMHPGGIPSFQTTGSLIVEVNNKSITALVSAGPLPCLSLYKPLWLTQEHLPWLESENSQELIKDFWFLREEFARYVQQGRLKDVSAYLEWRDAFEKDIIKRSRTCIGEPEKISLVDEAFSKEKEVMSALIKEARTKPPPLCWSPREAWYWKQHERFVQIAASTPINTSTEKQPSQ